MINMHGVKYKIETLLIIFFFINSYLIFILPFDIPKSSSQNAQKFNKFGSISPTFYNFYPNKSLILNPTCTLSVFDLESGLNIGSEEFGYTTDGSTPSYFINPHWDNFQDGLIAQSWAYLNPSNGYFNEANGNITIEDTGNNQWGTAPGLFQRITGDFSVTTKIYTYLSAASQQAGIYVYQDSNNILRYHYIQAPTGGAKNVAMRYRTPSYTNQLIGNTVTVGDVNPIWLNLERIGNIYYAYYSLNGLTYFAVSSGATIPDLANDVQVGIYVGAGLSAEFDEWTITPAIQCSGVNGTTDVQQITIDKVPFNQYNPSDNKVQVCMRDMNANLGTSGLYTVNISTDFGGPTFTNFDPNITSDITPDVTVQIQDAGDGLLIGSEQFAYSTDGSSSSNFINPHHDNFNDGTLANFWAIENSLGNTITETSNLSIQNNQFSTVWNDDPFLYQKIDRDFTVTAKVSAIVAGAENQSGIAFEEGSNIIRIMYQNASNGSINVSLSYSSDGGESSMQVGSVSIGETNPIWLQLRRAGMTFYGAYSTNGEYGIYSAVASVSLPFNYYGKIGLFTGGGEFATFAEWEVTPYLSITGTNGTVLPENLTTHEVPFNQIHESNNIIRFMMSDMTGTQGLSNIYTVNTTKGYYIYHPDLTLADKDGRIELFDYEGNTIWYYDDRGSDIEMLPDGNIMYMKTLSNGGFVRIVNYTDKSTIWEYNPSGAEILDWTHDADILPWGDILIADTTDDATHQDEVLIVDYATKNIEWKYICDENSYPNDVDYLPNGNILICLRNYDMVIEVNYTACKDLGTVIYPNYVVWSYGETGNYALMNHQHNPDRLPNGNTIICDSQNDRIIEVDPAGTLVWIYDGNGTTMLNWPRDADRLPNGNTLIGDSRNNRALEINTSTGEIVWEMSLGGGVGAYDVNRIDTTPPTAIIIAPLHDFYKSETIDVKLSSNDIDVDTFWYKIYNNSNHNWVDENIIIWNETIQRTFGNGNYTIYAWCNDTGYREGSWDWIPFNKGNVQAGNVTTTFEINTLMADFSNFRPNQTVDTTPTVYIDVQESIIGLKNGSEEFAYTNDGLVPFLFGNPHQDLFNDGTLAPFWYLLNAVNGTIQEENGVLNLTDNNRHEWYNGSHDAMMIYQNLVGDFTLNTKISIDKIEPTNYFGIIAYQDDSNYLTVMYHNSSDGELNVIFAKTIAGNTTKILSESFPSFGFLIPIWLSLTRIGASWSAAFSPDGDTYANYYEIGSSQDVSFTSNLKVGLFCANGSSALFDDWMISPYIEINGSVSPTDPKTMCVHDVRFNQYDEINNKIRFQVKNQLDITSSSPVFTVNISNFAISFRDNTIYGDSDKKIYEIDRFGTMVHLIDVSGMGVVSIADVERLSNGNILFVDMHPTGSDSAIYEINSSGYVVWSFKPTGSNRLEWTHDADRLPNGNTLIADTSDSPTHTDRVIEVNSTGDIVWAYYPGEGSYPNDLDRLSNGNTLISLRDNDKVIEVAPNGTIIWDYSPNNPSILNHQHNPDRLINGNTIICDSENNRIIEINSTTKEIVWMYDGNGTTTLNWPRDADLLSDGNLLITDSSNHRIIEVNRTNGEIVWEHETIGTIYEADRLNSFILPVKILSPMINETWISQTIEVVLSSPNHYTSDLLYRIYDNTTEQWVDIEEQTAQKYQIPSNKYWNIRQRRILQDNHTYTVYAWIIASPKTVDGGDQFQITQSTPTISSFKINCSYIPDSNSPYPGFTLFPLDVNAGSKIREINLEGDIIWEYQAFPGSNPYDCERLPNGNTLWANCRPPAIQEVQGGGVIEVDLFGNIVWSYPIAASVHDADRLPNGNTVFFTRSGDWWNYQEGDYRSFWEVTPDGEIVFSWNIFDWFPPPLPANTHFNDVDLLANGNFLISARDWDQIWEINRTGHIVWSYGEIGNYALMNHQHNPDRLENGNTIIADSENNRIIEINPQGQIIWMYDGNGTTTLNWPRDADRLPNGNTLIADSHNKRLIEINQQGQILWEINSVPNIYCADRLDLYAPYVLINSPINKTYTSNEIPLQLFCPEKDVDTIWYNIYDNLNHSWLFSSNQTYHPNSNLYLSNGNYTLFAWSNDTGRAPGTMDDIHSNTQEIPSIVQFIVDCKLTLLSPQNIIYTNPLLNIIIENTTTFEEFSAILELGTNQTPFELVWNGSYFIKSIMLASDGYYKLSIEGNDSLNTIYNYVIWFTLDRTVPQFKDLSIAYNLLELGLSQQVSLTFLKSSSLKFVVISIKNGPNETMFFNGTHYSYNWIPLMTDLGLNSFTIFAENYNGYKNSTNQIFTVVDTTAPQIHNISMKSEIQWGQYQVLSFNVFDFGEIKEVKLQLENGTTIYLTGIDYYSYSWIPKGKENTSLIISLSDISNNTIIIQLYFSIYGIPNNNWIFYLLFVSIGIIAVVFTTKILITRRKSQKNATSRGIELGPIKQIESSEPVKQESSSTSNKERDVNKPILEKGNNSADEEISFIALLIQFCYYFLIKKPKISEVKVKNLLEEKNK